MNAELINQLSDQLGPNGLPYSIPLHPNLVHLTLGLFIIGITFDIVGALFPSKNGCSNFSQFLWNVTTYLMLAGTTW